MITCLLGDLTCGGKLSFTYTATSGPDGCQDAASCNATFTVAAAEDLTVECPTDPMLPACSSTADILAAYNAWVAGFSFDGGCDVSDNIDNVPTGDLTCGVSSASPIPPPPDDGCQDMASAAPLSPWARSSLTVDCPADLCCYAPALPTYWYLQRLGTGFSFDGGCDVSDNSASIPAWETSPAA
ncbi:MAG: hypothetical protein H6559_37375 [Lewinellaceae bacterium]|nr:hypothetical protein [Lewinellaceae bacterium]